MKAKLKYTLVTKDVNVSYEDWDKIEPETGKYAADEFVNKYVFTKNVNMSWLRWCDLIYEDNSNKIIASCESNYSLN